jgi:hypothetical protein
VSTLLIFLIAILAYCYGFLIFLIEFLLLCTEQRKYRKIGNYWCCDPSGRGLGFSYVRVAPKAPASNSALKKKSAAAKGTTVTGTDADLRRLSMDAAREVPSTLVKVVKQESLCCTDVVRL